MDVTAPAPESTLAQRAAALACGCALAAAGVLVAANDPSAAGSRFPACAFHAVTGLWCPGCGLTRGTHHLLRGDLGAALGANVFTPLVLLAVVGAWSTWTRRAFGRQIGSMPSGGPRRRRQGSLEGGPGGSAGMGWSAWMAPMTLVLVVAFGVARNLPVPGLRQLAP